MTVRSLTRQLRTWRGHVEDSTKAIADLDFQLKDRRQLLRAQVDEYNRLRNELFLQELTDRGLTWCPRCERPPVAKGSALYFLIVGWKVRRSGRTVRVSYEPRDEFHRVCPACLAELEAEVERADSLVSGLMEVFESAGHYVLQEGQQVDLPSRGRLRPPTEKQVDAVAEEWGLPPKLELSPIHPGYSQKLIIHEPQKAEDAEAA